MNSTQAKVLGPADGRSGRLGAIGVRFMVDAEESGGGFALVEHPMPPRALAAPLHRHSREDEYSYVVEGRVGALLGDEVVYGEPGDLIFKPRGQWHTFWNAGDEPARLLEFVSPGGFEGYFEEIAICRPVRRTSSGLRRSPPATGWSSTSPASRPCSRPTGSPWSAAGD